MLGKFNRFADRYAGDNDGRSGFDDRDPCGKASPLPGTGEGLGCLPRRVAVRDCDRSPTYCAVKFLAGLT